VVLLLLLRADRAHALPPPPAPLAEAPTTAVVEPLAEPLTAAVPVTQQVPTLPATGPATTAASAGEQVVAGAVSPAESAAGATSPVVDAAAAQVGAVVTPVADKVPPPESAAVPGAVGGPASPIVDAAAPVGAAAGQQVAPAVGCGRWRRRSGGWTHRPNPGPRG
jgi:hypothetical protein